MSKNEVEKKLGKPFKIEFKKDSSGEIISTSHYKEALWTGSNHVTIENILIFKKDILIEIKQGEEIEDKGTLIQPIITK